ncbi:MAG: DEAD/DEAH box helicase [Candidatus Moraniibacteriota bacterium]
MFQRSQGARRSSQAVGQRSKQAFSERSDKPFATRSSNNKVRSRFSGAPMSDARGGRRSGGNRKRPSYDPTLFVRKAIQTVDTEPFQPEHRFVDFEIHPKLKENIAKRDYIHPTPIQDGSIPHILKGRDVIGIANTGTGKTAAFLLPLIHKVFEGKQKQSAIIIVPTRELAVQIQDELVLFAQGSGLRSALCIGGAHMDRQIADLRRKPAFVIGTPGRLKDLIERGYLDISHCNNVVLDEVDRMLDMGFIADIRHLLSLVHTERQSMFFSATMDPTTRGLALKFLNNPVTVTIKSRATAENVNQDVVYVARSDEKFELLHEMLMKPEFKKVLIFVQMKHSAEKLGKLLDARGFAAGSIHGDLSQGQRQRSLTAFRDDRMRILVATDVAARGLDIDNITHVINYDLPMAYEDYIHRIGRTGRGNKSGHAYTFIERY